ncbi:hypothetical protein BD289DRAFT_72021 [Coniella lustricola]|uniref:Uncharacterized protein n=1 Tax=Coniella lustricola TaxID=2025994 RepID=A0A2T2ZZV3_9PEZI|nr:hypothetical protein BD289DRAFT_72021 [Coniella lustricola]
MVGRQRRPFWWPKHTPAILSTSVAVIPAVTALMTWMEACIILGGDFPGGFWVCWELNVLFLFLLPYLADCFHK